MYRVCVHCIVLGKADDGGQFPYPAPNMSGSGYTRVSGGDCSLKGKMTGRQSNLEEGIWGWQRLARELPVSIWKSANRCAYSCALGSPRHSTHSTTRYFEARGSGRGRGRHGDNFYWIVDIGLFGEDEETRKMRSFAFSCHWPRVDRLASAVALFALPSSCQSLLPLYTTCTDCAR